eukprot:TRINITY_DN11848_c1_g2_i1.p1 TRINITY_DN11848_c1_g2~~TRINITY_DN11848_c1_g2_i1.p1  ORF type:complete len:129 (-),score=26.26 TRINITY_DN11848_c1_g2_i1:536-922(-)
MGGRLCGTAPPQADYEGLAEDALVRLSDADIQGAFCLGAWHATRAVALVVKQKPDITEAVQQLGAVARVKFWDDEAVDLPFLLGLVAEDYQVPRSSLTALAFKEDKGTALKQWMDSFQRCDCGDLCTW